MWSTRRPGVATTMSARQRKPSALRGRERLGGAPALPAGQGACGLGATRGHSPPAQRARVPTQPVARRDLRLLDEALLLLGQRLLPGDQGHAQRRGIRVEVEHFAHLEAGTGVTGCRDSGSHPGSGARIPAGPAPWWAARPGHAPGTRLAAAGPAGGRGVSPVSPGPTPCLPTPLGGQGPHTHLHHRDDEGQRLPTARRGRNTEVTGPVATPAHQKAAGRALQDSRDHRGLDWTGRGGAVLVTSMWEPPTGQVRGASGCSPQGTPAPDPPPLPRAGAPGKKDVMPCARSRLCRSGWTSGTSSIGTKSSVTFLLTQLGSASHAGRKGWTYHKGYEKQAR